VDIDKAFPSKYLKACDFEDGDQTLTIERIILDTVGQGDDAEQKPIVYFRGLDQGLCLNKTNANTIKGVLGTGETDRWIGRRIIVGYSEVPFKDQIKPAIRVRIKKPDEVKPLDQFIEMAKQWPDEFDVSTPKAAAMTIKALLKWNSADKPTDDDIMRAVQMLRAKADPSLDPFGDDE